ncbi:MAG: methylmalonyl-CoA epimerase [Candidatus Cloacimonetes bacterium 4572_55]|nr:MAG: methylmalonyl-CoA epimerase [Candidatus Cloacimonetes bacterium 4572_55]
MSNRQPKIDHLGIAVKSIEERVKFYEHVLGLEIEHTEIVESEKVKAAFLNVGGTHIELLEPTSDDSAIAKSIAKRGEGIHHICYEVPDMQSAIDKCKAMGMRMLDKAPRPGAKGKLVAFIHPKSAGGILVELCQTENSSCPA